MPCSTGRWFGCSAKRGELYFSRENVVHPTFDQLESGAQVQFIEETGAEGLQAKRVSVGKHRY